ncbi:MAG TPA: hypothetical protein IAC46_01945 [Candidatus Onthoplasma faecigallinarum]|nr:hypothetical protein [Candidatus Onthoplasma faecigallinarum]
MPRDFKSFTNENKRIIDENQEKANEYQHILDKYKNMSNNELMSNLFSEASKLKKEGKLDDEQLNSLKSTISPFLNNNQQQMLNEIIKAIHEQK